MPQFQTGNTSIGKLSSELKAEAGRIGFQLVGITPAISPAGFPQLQDWLNKGHAGEMNYLADREMAYSHPKYVLETVRSVIMLGVNYHTETPDSGLDLSQQEAGMTSPAIPAKVSRYAWGTNDYHDIIRKKLRRLGDYLHERKPDCRTRGVLDTAPLLERDFAKWAGLGWFGKNTMLINKHQGSCFFLAALLTDVELEYDEPHETSHCGTCTRCLDACPTDAFPKPYQLDARKCLSYLTIELRSQIPENLREGIGDWLFGCDICQDVCPWNRKAPISDEPEFQPVDQLAPADAIGILKLTPAEFRTRFRHSPLWRSQRKGLLRNAAIVIGNSGNSDGVPALCVALDDEEPLIRGAVAWALGQIGGEKSLAALQARHQTEDNPNVVTELNNAISHATFTQP